MKAGRHNLPFGMGDDSNRCASELTVKDDQGLPLFTLQCAYDTHPPMRGHEFRCYWSDDNADKPTAPDIPLLVIPDPDLYPPPAPKRNKP